MSNTTADSIYTPPSSLFAKLLACENLTVVSKSGARTAYFNPSTRVLTLPSWSGFTNDAWQLFIAHEVGHALYTPAYADHGSENSDGIFLNKLAAELKVTPGQLHTVLNILEDIRIERLIRQKYRGLSGFFSRGYNELLSKGFFGFKTITEAQNNWAGKGGVKYKTLDRLNIYAKVGSLCSLTLTASDDIRWYNAALAAQTFEDVVELAKDIVRTITAKNANKPKAPKAPKAPSISNDVKKALESLGIDEDEDDQPASPDIEEGESVAPAESEDDDLPADAPEAPESSDEGSEPTDSDDPGSTDEPADENTNEPQGSDASQGDSEPETLDSVTEKTGASVLSKSVGTYSSDVAIMDADLSFLNINDIKLETTLASWAISPETLTRYNALVQELKKKSTPTLSSMVSTFRANQAAKIAQKNMLSKSGEINPNLLASYKTTEDLFLRHLTTAKGVNHGFVLFVDWSASMNSTLPTVLWQTLNLVWLAETVRVPVEVYAFSNEGMNYSAGKLIQFYDSTAPAPLKLKAQSHLVSQILKFGRGAGMFENGQYGTWGNLSAPGRVTRPDYSYGIPSIVNSHIIAAAPSFTNGEWSEIFSVSFETSGTPLYHAILSSTAVVREFRVRHRVEKCLSVWLSDGANGNAVTVNNASQAIIPNKNLKLYSPITGNQYVVDENRHESSVFFNYHRDVTGAMVIVLDIGYSAASSFSRYITPSVLKANGIELERYGRRRRGPRPARFNPKTQLRPADRAAAFAETGIASITRQEVPTMGPDVVIATSGASWDANTSNLTDAIIRKDKGKADAQGLASRPALTAALVTMRAQATMRRFADMVVPFLAQGMKSR